MNADAPILLMHGLDGTVVSVEQSEEMETVMRHNKKPYVFVRIGDEDHWLTHEAGRIQTLDEVMKFVERYNPPG